MLYKLLVSPFHGLIKILRFKLNLGIGGFWGFSCTHFSIDSPIQIRHLMTFLVSVFIFFHFSYCTSMFTDCLFILLLCFFFERGDLNTGFCGYLYFQLSMDLFLFCLFVGFFLSQFVKIASACVFWKGIRLLLTVIGCKIAWI